MSSAEDLQAKEAARANRASQPGVVSVAADEAARLDERIAAKSGDAGISGPPPQQLQNLEADLLANPGGIRLATAPAGSELDGKQRAAAPAVVPGAVASNGGGLDSLESDVMAKQQGMNGAGPATAPGAVATGGSSLSQLEQDIAAKQGGRPAEAAAAPGAVAAGASLSQLEHDIAAKQGGRPAEPAAAPGAVAAGASLSQMEQDIAAKQRPAEAAAVPGAVAGGATAGASLSQLEQDIAAKQGGRPAEPATAPGATTSLNQLEQDISAKQEGRSNMGALAPGAAVAGGAAAIAVGAVGLSQMEQDIAAKSGAVPPSAGPPDLMTLEDAVAQKTMGEAPAGAGGLNALESEISEKGLAQGAGAYDPNDLGRVEADVIAKGESSMKHIDSEQAPSKLQEGGEPDVEFGMYDPNNEGLAVAMPVKEDEEDPFMQSAVEYDPDAKPPVHRRRRYSLYAFLALLALMSIAVAVTIGVVVADNNSNDGGAETSAHPRDNLGIEQKVESIVGGEVLVDPASPYSRALEWITYNDTMQVLPNSTNFVQRYILAYFYYATTEKTTWKTCNAVTGTDAPDACTYVKVLGGEKGVVEPLLQELGALRWLSAPHECLWTGITCDEKLQLRAIELEGMEMTGRFPEGVKHIPYLQSLILNWGGLYGPLPSFLSEAPHLVNLELQNNEFTGTIPDEWWDSRQLANLNLQNNRLTGGISPKVRNMVDLSDLNLQNNLLKGQIPTDVAALTQLKRLHLNKNALTGPIPTEITGMTLLEELWLQDNQLNGVMPESIGDLQKLKQLRLFGNTALGGPLPVSLYDLGSLWRLELTGCAFSGPLTEGIGLMGKMQELTLSNNQFSGPLPDGLKELQELRQIRVEGNSFGGVMPEEMCARRGTRGIHTMVADCQDGDNGVPEVECSCCSLCCNADGLECAPP